MFKPEVYTVIERLGVVGIVESWDGRFCRIMFELGKNEVEFAVYTVTALSRFRVIG
jgi:hypothetical protein